MVTTLPGWGTDLGFTVTVAAQTSAVSDATVSYALPVIKELSPAQGPTFSDPAVTVTVTGNNFAVADESTRIQVQFGNALDGTQLLLPAVRSGSTHSDEHSVTFTLPEGLGASRAVRLHLSHLRARQGSFEFLLSEPATFSYVLPIVQGIDVSALRDAEPAEIEAVDAAFGAALRSEVRRLRIIGSNFGPSAEVTGDGVGRAVRVLETSRGGTPLDGAVYSSANITVLGWDHTEVRAYTLIKYGLLQLEHTALDRFGSAAVSRSVPLLFSDLSPRLSDLSGGGPNGFDTVGGQVLTMLVGHLGAAETLRVAVANKTCAISDALGNLIADEDIRRVVIVEPKEGEVVTTDTLWEVNCVMPAGEGRDQLVLIYRDNVVSADLGEANRVSYAPPEVDALEIDGKPVVRGDDGVLSLVANTTGGSLVVTGTNFGECPGVDLGYRWLWFPPCEPPAEAVGETDPSAYVVSHTHERLELRVPPGQGANLDFTVVVAGQRSSAVIHVDFRPPSITRIDIEGGGSMASTAGGNRLVVHGWNFGQATLLSFQLPAVYFTPQDDVAAELGFDSRLDCTNMERVSHSELRCDLPEGGGRDLTAWIDVGGQLARQPAVLSYAPPAVTTMSATYVPQPLTLDEVEASEDWDPTTTTVSVGSSSNGVLTGPTEGGFVVALSGSNLGAANGSCVLLTSAALSDPAVTPRGRTGRVRCPQPRASDASAVAASDDDGSGDEDLYLPAGGRVPGDDIVPVISHSHNEIMFVMPPGMGSVHISVVVWGQPQPIAGAFRYTMPIVLELLPAHAPTEGGTALHIWGSNFGTPEFAPGVEMQVQFAKQLSDGTERRVVCSRRRDLLCAESGAEGDCPCRIHAHTHDGIDLVVPPGIGKDLEVSVTVVDGVTSVSSAPADFDYDPPQIVYLLPYDVDALGESIRIPGINFGNARDMDGWSEEELAVQVDINGQECLEAQRELALGASVLRCTTQPTVVGPQNVTIVVAGQTGFLAAETGAFYTTCRRDYYGRVSEVCLSCPRGATCAGDDAEPRAVEGWYNLNGTEETCAPERLESLANGVREFCNHVVPCEPTEACTGGNECGVGYIDKAPMFRCSSCDPCYKETPESECQGFFRRAGECIECPDNPLLLVIAFICMAVVVSTIGYLLNKHNVNLAFVSIGVDYFQVLAMFANSRVAWPPGVFQSCACTRHLCPPSHSCCVVLSCYACPSLPPQ